MKAYAGGVVAFSLLASIGSACCPHSREARLDTVFPSGRATSDGRAAFARFRTLVGSWEAVRTDGKKVAASYKEISNGSVVVETFTTLSGKETMTAYHPDGPRLMLTHYCAQGNQPRLQAMSISESQIGFRYIDASNLEAKQDLLASLTFSFTAEANTFERSETYRLASGGTETTVLTFRRAAIAQTEPNR